MVLQSAEDVALHTLNAATDAAATFYNGCLKIAETGEQETKCQNDYSATVRSAKTRYYRTVIRANINYEFALERCKWERDDCIARCPSGPILIPREIPPKR